MSAAAIKFICLGFIGGAVAMYFFLSSQLQKRRRAERSLRNEIHKDSEEHQAQVAQLKENHAAELKSRELDQTTLQQSFQTLAGEHLQKMIEGFQQELKIRMDSVAAEQTKAIDHNGEKVLDSYNSLGRLFLQAQEKLEDLQKKSQFSIADVQTQIEALQRQEAQLVQETSNLRRCLRSENQEMGRNWGEMSLQSLFEQGGLKESFDYEEIQVPLKGVGFAINPTETLRLHRVQLRGGRSIFIDSHHTLLSYFKDVVDVGEEEREVAERVLAKAIERRVELLVSETVKIKTEPASPFVFCFVGSEALMEFLIEKDFMALERARQLGVIFLGPTQFLPLLQIMSWGQQSLENFEQSRELLKLSRDLASSLNVFISQLSELKRDSRRFVTKFEDLFEGAWAGEQGVLPVLTKMAYLQKREVTDLYGAGVESAEPVKSRAS